MTDTPPPNPFLDVPALLDSSLPRPRGPWLLYGVGLFALMVTGSLVIERGFPDGKGRGIVNLLSGLLLVGGIAAMAIISLFTARAAQAEGLKLQSIEELIQLRRWAEAGILLQELLSQPTRTPIARTQGMVFLATTLARFHRFQDAIEVYDHLLKEVPLDPASTHALRLGRAMSILREDRLIDAHQAIGELRPMDGAESSSGLALVQMYRDVKTGHPNEALEIFDKNRDLLRKQLAHRSADGWALAGRAYDMIGNPAAAKAAWENATLLAPAVELVRRYPELTAFAEQYQPAPAPAEVL